MCLLRPAFLALVLALVSMPALAQDDDDLLSPLSPAPKKKPPKAGRNRGQSKASRASKAKPPPAEPEELLAPLPPPGKTELLVKVSGEVKGSRLWVDRKEVGTLPWPAIELSSGEHLVLVKRPGYSDFSKTVNVAAGKQTELNVSLDAVAGVISITSDQAGAVVLLDGRQIGPGPISELAVSPGEHRISVQKSGFATERELLVVRAGKDYSLSFQLKPESRTLIAYGDRPELNPSDPGTGGPLGTRAVEEAAPLHKRWYLWAGVAAVVVAAAAAGTVAAAQPGALTPDMVCKGTCDGVIQGMVPRF